MKSHWNFLEFGERVRFLHKNFSRFVKEHILKKKKTPLLYCGWKVFHAFITTQCKHPVIYALTQGLAWLEILVQKQALNVLYIRRMKILNTEHVLPVSLPLACICLRPRPLSQPTRYSSILLRCASSSHSIYELLRVASHVLCVKCKARPAACCHSIGNDNGSDRSFRTNNGKCQKRTARSQTANFSQLHLNIEYLFKQKPLPFVEKYK